MLLWQRGGTEKKQKTALIPKRDEGCLKSSVVPPKLQKSPPGLCRFVRCNAAQRPVRFAGSSGVA